MFTSPEITAPCSAALTFLDGTDLKFNLVFINFFYNSFCIFSDMQKILSAVKLMLIQASHPALLHYASVAREQIACMAGISYTLHGCKTLKLRL